jgi:catechol 2,3-dioxygenase-like lactoylglutathione lyase family enzyme
MGAVPAVRFSHMGMAVHDLEGMTQFYTRMLGFTVTDHGHLPGPDGKPIPLVFLSRDPEEHHQIVLAGNRPAELAFNPINQISMKVENLAALRSFFHMMRDAGADEIRPVTHGNAVSLYARDPEGNRLEFYIDTPWYVTQPMRVPVDLDQDEETIMRAVEAHARTLEGFRPRAAWVAEMRERMGISAKAPPAPAG